MSKDEGIVGTLHHIVYVNPGRAEYSYNHYRANRKDAKKVMDLATARYLSSNGMLGLVEHNYYPRRERVKVKDVSRKEIRETVEEALDNPASPLPLNLNALAAAVRGRRGGEIAKHTVELLKLRERLQAALGSTTAMEEELVGRVLTLSNRPDELTAVAKNVKLGNSHGSANVQARVKKDGTICGVIISGSPHAMTDERLDLLLILV
ncbi:MAG: hypothetical protein WDN66_05390 [Candidatus Saccharibacteria bacterium]